jgi:hypothetical protein
MPHRTAAAVALAALVVVCSGCGGGPSGPSGDATATTAASTAPEAPPGAVPVPREASIRALDGEPLRVALLGVRDPAPPSEGAAAPEEDRRYVAVELRISNAGQRPYDDTPANGATLRDTAGGEWIAGLDDPVAPGLGALTLAPGDSRTGWLTFEIPAGATPGTLRFAADGGFGGAATWRLR